MILRALDFIILIMINRRHFLTTLGMVPFLGNRLEAIEKWGRKENFYFLFNNLRDVEDGELKEFTTIETIEKIFEREGIPKGSTVIATGLRSGTVENPYEYPGELALHWKYGSPWNGKVTHKVDASPVAFDKKDPVVTAMVGVLQENTAHHFVIDDPKRAGTSLWTFYKDDTVKTIFKKGLHNAFSDVDGGAANDIFKFSQRDYESKANWRKKLEKHFPNLSQNLYWQNLESTVDQGVLEKEWMPYIKAQGWPGAAIILRGSFMNILQFHFREVKHQIGVSDPAFAFGKGTHGPLNIRFGREVRPFTEPGESEWTMMGFLWNFDHPTHGDAMKVWEKASDVFGHPFHVHGFRNDGSRMGHTLFAQLGTGKLNVSLYPLGYNTNQDAFFFNNDLKVVPKSFQQLPTGLSVQIQNDGENFNKDIVIRLEAGNQKEDVVLPLLKPHEVATVMFSGNIGKNTSAKRKVTLDPTPDFNEGGKGASNNRLAVEL